MGSPVSWSRVDEQHSSVLIVATGPSAEKIPFSFYRKCAEAGVHIMAVGLAVNWLPVCHSWMSVDPGLRTRSILKNQREGVKYWCAVPPHFGSPDAQSYWHRGPIVPFVNYLVRTNLPGHPLNEDPSCAETGNSAYGALNVAWHMEARKIVLVGVDGTRQRMAFHRNGERPNGDMSHMTDLFAGALPQLRLTGTQVVNLSARSVIHAFPKMKWENFLEWLLIEATSCADPQ